MRKTQTTYTPSWIPLGLVMAGALALAACAPVATLSEGKQSTGASTASASPAERATLEVTPPEATHTPVPSETSVGRTYGVTHTPFPSETVTAVVGQPAEVSGAIESIDGSVLVIAGRTVITTIKTEIKIDLSVGLMVTVQGTWQSDGSILAREIKE